MGPHPPVIIPLGWREKALRPPSALQVEEVSVL